MLNKKSLSLFLLGAILFAATNAAQAGPPKAQVCHYQKSNDAWKLLMLPDKAANAHMANHPEDGAPLDGRFTEECTLKVCDGTVVGGLEGCWYLGDLGQSCSDVCADKGAYDASTDIAGNGGDGTDCNAVLDALGAPGEKTCNGTAPLEGNDATEFLGSVGQGRGCYYSDQPDSYCNTRPTSTDVQWFLFTNPTEEGWMNQLSARACSCK